MPNKQVTEFVAGVVIGFLTGIIILGVVDVDRKTSSRTSTENKTYQLIEIDSSTPTPFPIYVTATPRRLPNKVAENHSGEVVYFNDAPTKWKVCVNEAKVYSNPGTNPEWYLYSLVDETQVMVRELDRGTRTWAMIQVSHWVKFTDLCNP